MQRRVAGERETREAFDGDPDSIVTDEKDMPNDTLSTEEKGPRAPQSA